MSVAQSYPTLCDSMNCSPPGSSVHGILQARILEWVTIPFSRGSSWSRDQTRISCFIGRFFTNWATRVLLICIYLAAPGLRFDAGDLGSILGLGRSPGEGHGNPLHGGARRTPWTEEPGGLQFMESQRVRRDWSDLAHKHKHFRAVILNLFGTRDWFRRIQFLHGLAEACSGFGMIQAHYIYCTLYFYYYSISSTSDHQALALGSWESLI